jgi:hypothetical protein
MTSLQIGAVTGIPMLTVSSICSGLQARGIVRAVGRVQQIDGHRSFIRWALVAGAVRPTRVAIHPEPPLPPDERPEVGTEPIVARRPLRYITIGHQTLAVMWDGSKDPSRLVSPRPGGAEAVG